MNHDIASILMVRDGITESEAKEQIEMCREELNSGNWDAISEVLGLEDDYIFDIL